MDIKKGLIFVGLIIAGVIATGLLLNLAGSGTLGSVVKDLAKKTTNGFGDSVS